MVEEEKIDQAGLKRLREERAAFIDRARSTIKIQTRDIKRIKEQLQSGGKTVPEIAAATGLSASRVLLYISGLRKYGLVAEGEKSTSYFEYTLAG